MNWYRHLRTVQRHRKLVRQYCFRLGLYKQGLTHDLSKYSPTEFLLGVKYYQGFQSPHNGERAAYGYSKAWLHHKGRNRHHLEFWTDYASSGNRDLSGIKMPPKYVAEMFCDRLAACKIYNKDAYTDGDSLAYYERAKKHYLLHPETRATLEFLLHLLADQGEDAVFSYIRTQLLKKKPK